MSYKILQLFREKSNRYNQTSAKYGTLLLKRHKWPEKTSLRLRKHGSTVSSLVGRIYQEPKVSHRKDRVHVSHVGKKEARPAVKRELVLEEAGLCQASHAGEFTERHP